VDTSASAAWAAALAAVGGGLIGAGGTYLATRKMANAQTNLARDQRNHEQELASRERKKDAYLAMLEVVQRGNIRIQSTRAVNRTGPPPEDAREVTHDESVSVIAMLKLAGSKRVYDLYADLDLLGGGPGMFPEAGAFTEEWMALDREMNDSRDNELSLSSELSEVASGEF
jgi:hypothetical protein